MGWWLLASLLGAIASLAAARWISSPRWIDALWATGACGGLALAVGCGLLARRILSAEAWKGAAAAALAVGAAVGRFALVSRIASDPLRSVTINFGEIAIAATTVVWGALALLWGVMATSEAVEREGRPHIPLVLLAASAVVLSLYSLAPLWSLLGLRINLWTVIGLFALAAAAYGVGSAYRAVCRRRDQGP